MTGEHHPELPYWLALRRAGLGSHNFALLLAQFSTIEAAWSAPRSAILAAGIEVRYVTAIEKARTAFDPDHELAWLERLHARAYTWLDADFPSMLREVPQSPPVIFAIGNQGPQFERAVAIVGTRQVTPYGRQVCEAFCGALADAGVAIVSGLARGVDAIAHRVALEHGVPTVAVLAGGLDRIFPKENASLAERIKAQGTLVSEYPPGIPARPDYFPRRNRILSGLAQATLVIEAGEGSGALHTANWAFEQNRDVFAVPGSIFSRQSQGTNQLIRETTAKLVASPEQMLQELNLVGAQRTQLTFQDALPSPLQSLPRANVTNIPPADTTLPKVALDPSESLLVGALEPSGRHIDDLSRALGIPAAAVSSTLLMLELRGLVRQVRPMVYAPASA